MPDKIWKEKYFFTIVIFPLGVLGLYFLSFSKLFSPVVEFPLNVNIVFANRSWKNILLLFGGIYIVYSVFLKLKGRKLLLNNSVEKMPKGDFLLMLLPLTPVVQYIINQQEILSFFDSLYVFAFFVLFSGIYIYALPAIFGRFGSTPTLMILGLTFTFSITSMASFSNYFNWFESGSYKVQVVFFSGVFLVTWFLYYFDKKETLRLIITTIFIINSLTQLLETKQLMQQVDNANISPIHFSENMLISQIEERIPNTTPNIYLLIYDAYVSSETMQAYGIDNSAQEKYLQSVGFELYPHTYSVQATSVKTMSTVLNASLDFYGERRRASSGDGVTQNILQGFGYETYGLFHSDYFFRGIGSTYDFTYPEARFPNVLISAIIMGEFRFDIGLTNLPDEEFLETKKSIFENVPRNPIFVYMHTSSPSHSQNSGFCRDNETDLYRYRLIEANLEMKQDITTILDKDPEAIIIVASDHGPFLTKNCTETEKGNYEISEITRLDIQDRFGTFLAIKWPTEDFSHYDDIIVLQDIFPAVFAYLLNDTNLLESRIEPSTGMANFISGASVQNGIIFGGVNDGEVLFIGGQ